MPEAEMATAATPPRRIRGAARATKTTGSITRADLCEAVHAELGLARSESSELVEQVLDQICETLISGTNVKVSSFGSFVLRNKGMRIGRNPKTGQEVPIAPRTVLTFRPSQLLRARINGGVDPGPEPDDVADGLDDGADAAAE